MAHTGIGTPRLTVVIVLLVNVLLIAGYLWSRGGQTTHVRLEARGNEFTAFVDGRQTMSAEMDAPADGGLTLAFESQAGVPSLPETIGVDSVRIIDLGTGATLFEDNFAGGRIDRPWTPAGRIALRDGVLRIEGPASISRTDATWGDVAVDVVYRNIGATSIGVRTRSTGESVIFAFSGFRTLSQRMILQPPNSSGQPGTNIGGPPLELDRAQALKSILAMILRPYLFAATVTVLACAAAVALGSSGSWLPAWRAPARWPRPALSADEAWYAVGALALIAFGVALFLDVRYSAQISHWPDSTSYIFQAKIFASGHLAAPTPPVTPSFDFFYPPLTLVTGGKWASIFPFGHPLVLAIGERFGVIWLIPPMIGAACVGLFFAAGKRIYPMRTALLAVALLASSPFFLMQASNFMSHNTAMFYLLVALLCTLTRDRRPLLFGAIAGLAFGLLFNTRPLTAIVLIPPFVALLLRNASDPTQRRDALKHSGAFIAGGLVMLLAYAIYNYGTSGDFLHSSYQSRDAGQIGFGGAHSVDVGVQNEQTQMAFLLLVLNGWPQYIGLAFVLLPFALGTRNPWDWFCLTCSLLIMSSTVLFSENGVMQGPRLWYEAMPFLLLLTARGVECTIDMLARLAGAFARDSAAARRTVAAAAGAALYASMAALIAASVYGWLLGQHPSWKAEFVPERASALRDFNGIDGRMQQLLDQVQPHHALVLVNDCPHWQCYGSVLTLNDPALDGDVVFAKNIPAQNAKLFNAYRDRTVFIADYYGRSLVPYHSGAGPRAVPGTERSLHAPTGADILALTPEATPPTSP
jgi:hypothetical protein